MAFVLGKDMKAYRNTGAFATPVWDEVGNFANGKTGISIDMFDARRRASGVFKQHAATGLDFTVSWRMLWDLADADFAAVLAAAIALTEIDMLFLSGVNTSGANQGPRMSAAFSKFDRDEDEDALANVDVEAKPGIAYVPLWFTGTA